MDKKAVSEMVAYVLLVVIALAVSVIVYSVLRVYIYKVPEACPAGSALIIDDYSCNSGLKILNLTIKNQGTHSLDGFRILIANATGKPATRPLKELTSSDSALLGEVFFKARLNSSDSEVKIFNYTDVGVIYKIQIKPFRNQNNMQIICEDAIFTQDITGCG